MSKHHGQLELTWTDKNKALLSTCDAKYDYIFVDPSDYRVSEVRLLHEVERFDVPTPEDRPSDFPQPSTENLLITGDAMHVLCALNTLPQYADKYLGKVKLCYIDPPFNTGQVFDNYEDNIEHSIWLTMLRDRLEQIKPLLSDDGSVWVHLDDTEVHRCRVVLDEVLGINNFVATVIWQKADNTRSNNKGFSTSHDTILVYRKSDKSVPNRMRRSAALDLKYTSPDGDPDRWFDGPTTVRGDQKHHEYIHAIQHPVTGELLYPSKGRHWAKSHEWILAQMSEYAPYELRDIGDAEKRAAICGISVDDIKPRVDAVMLSVPADIAAERAMARYKQGHWPDIVLRSGGRGGIGFKLRIPESGSVPTTWWTHEEVGSNRTAKSEIKALFPADHAFDTPKPERLLQRIVQIATDPGDIVLDCFAGSGTTAAVAHKLARRWVAVELLPSTVEKYAKPRLLKVLKGDDRGGVTLETTRVAATTNNELPDGMLPTEAQEFNRLLRKVLKEVESTPDQDTVKALRAATKTRDEVSVTWHGGGGFTHMRVGESMFSEFGGRVFLADWATNSALTTAMCAQLGIRHRPDGIFAGSRGRVRYVILDGMVTESTVTAILDQLPADEIVEVWATQVNPAAAEVLRKARPGSSLASIPASVLDSYRRKAARRSPFKPAAAPKEEN
ncbi:site-specific DNA-methyltransferase [Mycobacterium persicum]|uniref:site-specific DNA-methyltransferase n=1 Tax=Mycobacterium persicum TaxID=1487726 RepID=UPI000C07C3A9|nr:site-specific DNA-methyltransferase [Mycobacterium persicum]